MNARRQFLLLVVTLLSAACSTRRPPPPGASGDVIYELQNCANCHGPAREGTRLAPPLAGLAAHWTRDSLAEYLADPRAMVAREARLKELDKAWSSDMGPYANLSHEERLVLADWLLLR
ncbi:MAG: cytochrome c [Planctomycetota bacterium]